MRLHLTMSGRDASPRQHGGVPFTADALAAHGPRMHLAERDPQHHGWASRGVTRHGLRLRILLSFHYYQDTDLDALFAKHFTEPYPEVFLDSGAFSAMTQGGAIDLDAYVAFIARFGHFITTYANADVIGDPAATWDNQRRMEDAGLSPLPVFHGGASWAWLERYLDAYPYVALGGLVGKLQGAKGWLVRCFQMAAGRAVFHGFGVTTWEVLRDFRWYSVDSSSWGQGFRFGTVPVFDERRGTFVKIKLGDGPGWAKHAALVSSLGFDWRDFADRARNDRSKVCAISALSYMLAERWLRARHGEVRIPTRDEAPPGPAVHLVTASPSPDRNMGIPVLADALSGGCGPRIHLADTSNGINYGDAERGVKTYLADARPGRSHNDVLAADAGLRVHLAEGDRGAVRDERRALDGGLKLHLANDQIGLTSHRRAADGLRVYLTDTDSFTATGTDASKARAELVRRGVVEAAP